MSDTNSPTCVLSSTCLQPPSNHNQLVRIPTEVDSSRSTTGLGPVLLPRQQVVGAVGSSLSNANCQDGCSPINLSFASVPAPEIDNDTSRLAPPKSPRGSRTSGWKTSKFFSKSMTSGEILRGLKKLSLSSSSSASTTPNNEEQQPICDSNKSFKSRLVNFKKRSSYGNEEVSSDGETVDKASASSKSAESSKNNVQDEGIVCKKEDLKALICSATKRIPLCSPRKKKALRQTKSASFEPPQEKKVKEPVRRAGSEESRSRKSVPTIERDYLPSAATVATKIEFPKPPPRDRSKSPTPVILPQLQQKVELAPPAITVAQPTCASKVKWDDTNVVDAVLIGDAIESFLKGSMSGSEKDTKLFPKMTFRKNSFEKKA